MCKNLGAVLVVLALASASCDGNPFGNLEAEYSGQDAIESPQPGVDSTAPDPEPDVPETPVFVCEDEDNDGFCGNSQTTNQDCDDNDKSIHPNTVEVCDNVDQNCNGVVDESTGSVWYLDSDGDGFGDSDQSIVDGCDGANFLVAVGGDCDDSNKDVNPSATEVCDGVDNDCDEDVDDADTSLDDKTQKSWYIDEDNDGFGNSNESIVGCSGGYFLSDVGGDCDDEDSSSYPDADEVCDETDNDCDGLTDEGVQTFSYLDKDNDGFGDALMASVGCGVADGYVLDKTDCNDSASHTNPDAEEICDGEDNDCDGKLNEVAAGGNLCDDGNDLTVDSCDAGECAYEDVDFIFTCELPDGFSAGDGWACGAGVFFDDEDGYSEVLMIEEGVLTLPATEVCEQVSQGYTLYVNSYIVQEEVDMAFFWVGGEYVTVSVNNEEVHGTPGNVTILWPGLDFNYVLSDLTICK